MLVDELITAGVLIEFEVVEVLFVVLLDKDGSVGRTEVVVPDAVGGFGFEDLVLVALVDGLDKDGSVGSEFDEEGLGPPGLGFAPAGGVVESVGSVGRVEELCINS